MAHYFLDSSGLVKRYVAETGSGWVQNLCTPANTIYISRITGAEVIAAIFRRLPMGDYRVIYKVLEEEGTILIGRIVRHSAMRMAGRSEGTCRDLHRLFE